MDHGPRACYAWACTVTSQVTVNPVVENCSAQPPYCLQTDQIYQQSVPHLPLQLTCPACLPNPRVNVAKPLTDILKATSAAGQSSVSIVNRREAAALVAEQQLPSSCPAPASTLCMLRTGRLGTAWAGPALLLPACTALDCAQPAALLCNEEFTVCCLEGVGAMTSNNLA